MQRVNQTETIDTKTYPMLLSRVQSIFIDGMLVIISMYIISQILSKMHETPNWVRGALFIGLWFVYEPICMTLGGTLGNYLIGIRVRCFNDETKKLNIIQAYIRFTVKVLLGWISFLTIHMNPQKRALHDLASGSVMLCSDKRIKELEAEKEHKNIRYPMPLVRIVPGCSETSESPPTR